MVREIAENELNELLRLYLHLHEKSLPEMNEHLKRTWDCILKDENHHIIVNEIDGKIISSCVCVIIPNLTRNVRPYAIIENVVTHSDFRRKGHATECLNYAKEIAKKTAVIKSCCSPVQRTRPRLIFIKMRDITARTKRRLFNGLNNY